MAETPDLFLFVQSVRTHFELTYDNHVLIELFQVLLGHIEGVWRGVELVGLEALVAESDLKWLIFGLSTDNVSAVSKKSSN